VLGLPSRTLTTLSEVRPTFRSWLSSRLQVPCSSIHEVADFNNDQFFQSNSNIAVLHVFARHPLALLCPASDLLMSE
jgi:hypothetical protein